MIYILFSILVFISVYLITIGDSLSYYFTIVEKNRKQSFLWGFISWFISATIFLFILKSDYPLLYILCGAVSGALGNYHSIFVIKNYKKLIQKIFKKRRKRNATKNE